MRDRCSNDLDLGHPAPRLVVSDAILVTVPLGPFRVGRLGLGCFALSGSYGAAPPPSDAIHTLHYALDLGMNLLDTSDAYAAGANETLIGEALRDRRPSAVISTKFGWVLDASGAAVRRDSSPAWVRSACEASLRRLRTDWIDVYVQHRVDPATPIEETVGALTRLRDEGKIRAYGLSEAGPATLRRANSVWRVAALQTEYSLWSREPERELLPLCEQLDVRFVGYSPLGRGFLTGTIRDELPGSDYRSSNPRFQAGNLRSNVVLVDRLVSLAAGLGCTSAQLALAWLLAQRAGVIPIPSTRRKERIAENLGALHVSLDEDLLAAIEEAIPSDEVAGARHPADHMETIGL